MLKRLIITGILIVVVAGVGVFGYFAVINRQLNINHWFTGGQPLGVDVSSYQVNVDFNELAKQGVQFAYIKSTEGSSHVDPSFSEKWQAVANSGIIAGAYHYFSYQSSGATQAENFINTVGDLTERLIPAVDMELTPEEVKNPPEKDDVVRKLKAFLSVVEEKYNVKPLIYSRQDYYAKYLADDFSDYPRWITNVFFPVWFEAGDTWTVWQYNDRGEMAGYSGEKYIDLNVVNNKFGLDSLKYK